MRTVRKKTWTSEQALIKMADLCARSEQCAFDISRKLRVKGLAGDQIAEIIDYLTEHKFIDSFRFARSFARDKIRFSAWGRIKIRAALIARRIPEAVISQAFAEVDPSDYSDAASRAASSRAASLDLSVYDDRLRLFRYMMSRGFEPDVANREVARLRRLSE